jgi:hypothetical protein
MEHKVCFCTQAFSVKRPRKSFEQRRNEMDCGYSEKQHAQVTFEQLHAFSLFTLGVDEAEQRVICTI